MEVDATIHTQALIPIIGILIYYLGFRDDIWEDMGGKAAEL